jgi:4a-hydroxytetrahydrobiopterin dehydratase
MEKLAQQIIDERLLQFEDWLQEDVKWLVKKYRFPSFAKAMSFVHRVADISETENHHPFFSVDFKVVTVRITSWHAAGITELDFHCIAQYEEAYRELNE